MILLRILLLFLLSVSASAQIINQYFAGSGTLAEYQNVLDYSATQNIRKPTALQQGYQNTFFNSLKTIGMISAGDCAKLMVTNGPVDFTNINWISTGSNNSIRVNAPSFIKNGGFKFNGTNNYINLNWAPSSGVNFTQNSCEEIIIYDDITQGTFPDGVREAASPSANNTNITPWSASGQAISALNGGNTTVSDAQFNGAAGIYFHGRTSSSSSFIKVNSNPRVTYSSTSTGRTSLTQKLGCLDTNGSLSLFNTRKVLFYWSGGLLTTTQEADFITAWNTYIAAIASESPQTTLGTIYSKSSWTSTDLTNDFINNGATVSVIGNKLHFSGGSGTFTQTLELAGSNTCKEYWKIDIDVTIPSTIDAASFGFGVGLKSTNTNAQLDVVNHFDCSTSSNRGKALTATSSNGTYTNQVNTTALTIAGSDNIHMIFERIKNAVTVTVANKTTDPTESNPKTVTYTYGSGAPQLPNTSRFAIYSFGGAFDINSLTITSNEITYAPYAIVGDSKTAQYRASLFDLRFATLIGNKVGQVVTLGGGSDRSQDYLDRVQEIINLHPQAVILCGASNDPRTGVSSSTTISNYDSFVSTLTSAGIRVIHTTGFYETSGIDQATLQTHINTTYSSADVIDTLPTALILSGGDGIHPDDSDEITISNLILTSGKL